jgi:hypothetical protein
MGMTKDEFTRKVMGHKQTQKNEWLKKELTKGLEADCVAIDNSYRISKRTRNMR